VKISDALEGIQRLYTEAAPLIYYVEEHPKYVAKMDAIIKAIEGLDHGVGHPASCSLSHCASRWTEGCRRNID